jgi:hypothetical protein
MPYLGYCHAFPLDASPFHHPQGWLAPSVRIGQCGCDGWFAVPSAVDGSRALAAVVVSAGQVLILIDGS